MTLYNYPKSNIHEINNMKAREKLFLNREFNLNPNLTTQYGELITLMVNTMEILIIQLIHTDLMALMDSLSSLTTILYLV